MGTNELGFDSIYKLWVEPETLEIKRILHISVTWDTT